MTTIASLTCLKGQDSNSLAPVIFNGKYCFTSLQTQVIVSKIVSDSVKTEYIKQLEAYSDSVEFQLELIDTQIVIKDKIIDNCNSKLVTLKSINDNLKQQNNLQIDIIKEEKHKKNKWKITAIAGWLVAILIAV